MVPEDLRNRLEAVRNGAGDAAASLGALTHALDARRGTVTG